MICGDIAVLVLGNFAGRVAKGVPNGDTATILLPCALDLVCRCSNPPDKVLWKDQFGHPTRIQSIIVYGKKCRTRPLPVCLDKLAHNNEAPSCERKGRRRAVS